MKADVQAWMKGFGIGVPRAMDRHYRQSGVDRIEVRTAREGGVVGALAGFDFIPDQPFLSASINSIRGRIDSIYSCCSNAAREQLDVILNSSDGPVAGYPSPNELANLTGDSDETALGRRLTKDSIWYGMKVL
ncbi:hypothetical protein IU459_36285 [Nocardia amamiensis]|uniref:Uncharacterized protein n=1 Tax=Nocardia amamiensis TaxID=404578 RepID=A0ABS0D261_9NOCA|nr:hypothetical protein [Nocardia amamiensis]